MIFGDDNSGDEVDTKIDYAGEDGAIGLLLTKELLP